MLSLLVGCFECFGFPVKCVEKVGFWGLVFIVFPVTAVTLDTNFAILGVQNLSFGGLLPPFYHPGDHFVSLGTPWGTMGAAGRTRGGPKQDF